MDYKQVSLEGTNEDSEQKKKRYINILSKESFTVNTELQIFIKTFQVIHTSLFRWASV